MYGSNVTAYIFLEAKREVKNHVQELGVNLS
jgi:hypothetical protein